MSSSEKDIFSLTCSINISLYLGFTKIQGVYLLHPIIKKFKNPTDMWQSSLEEYTFQGMTIGKEKNAIHQ